MLTSFNAHVLIGITSGSIFKLVYILKYRFLWFIGV